jgi:hypothetical protein
VRVEDFEFVESLVGGKSLGVLERILMLLVSRTKDMECLVKFGYEGILKIYLVYSRPAHYVHD